MFEIKELNVRNQSEKTCVSLSYVAITINIFNPKSFIEDQISNWSSFENTLEKYE